MHTHKQVPLGTRRKTRNALNGPGMEWFCPEEYASGQRKPDMYLAVATSRAVSGPQQIYTPVGLLHHFGHNSNRMSMDFGWFERQKEGEGVYGGCGWRNVVT